MNIAGRSRALFLLGALLSISARGQDQDVHMAGTLSTKPLLIGVVHAMQQEKALHVALDADFTSAQAIDAVATAKDGVALITKQVTGEDRAAYPEVDLLTIPIGMEVVALGVSNDVWQSGLHSVTRETMRAIYERKLTNWRQAGGPDEKITLFNFEQGSGIWEIFTEWLYGDNRKAPIPKVEKVAANEDARDSLEFTPGSFVPLAAGFADGSRCRALGVDLGGGKTAFPAPVDVAVQTYPIVRPILALVVGRATLGVRAITEYLTGPEGQALVKKTGFLGLDAVPKPPPSDY